MISFFLKLPVLAAAPDSSYSNFSNYPFHLYNIHGYKYFYVFSKTPANSFPILLVTTINFLLSSLLTFHWHSTNFTWFFCYTVLVTPTIYLFYLFFFFISWNYLSSLQLQTYLSTHFSKSSYSIPLQPLIFVINTLIFIIPGLDHLGIRILHIILQAFYLLTDHLSPSIYFMFTILRYIVSLLTTHLPFFYLKVLSFLFFKITCPRCSSRQFLYIKTYRSFLLFINVLLPPICPVYYAFLIFDMVHCSVICVTVCLEHTLFLFYNTYFFIIC